MRTLWASALHLFLVALACLCTCSALAEPRAQELVELDRYLGTWNDTTDPAGVITTRCEWILDGRFLRHSWTFDTGTGEPKTVGMQMMSYDAVNHLYRGWTFLSDGRAEQGEGTWDAASSTFTWKARDMSNGQNVVAKATFVGEDEEVVSFTITGSDGKIVSEYRRKKAAPQIIAKNNDHAKRIYAAAGFAQAVYVPEAGGSLYLSKPL